MTFSCIARACLSSWSSAGEFCVKYIELHPMAEAATNASQRRNDFPCNILRPSMIPPYHSLRSQCDEHLAPERRPFACVSLDSKPIIRAIDLMERKWWIVIAGCITHAVNTGFCYFGMSAFFPSFEREFGWSRTAISGAFSLARVESGILGPIEGYIVDRVGPRRVMYIGIIVCTLGFISLCFVASLPMLYVSVVLGIVLGSSLGYHMPISLLIAKNFR